MPDRENSLAYAALPRSARRAPGSDRGRDRRRSSVALSYTAILRTPDGGASAEAARPSRAVTSRRVRA
jgi:hypothetical protein